jgi:hypothetical protein
MVKEPVAHRDGGEGMTDDHDGDPKRIPREASCSDAAAERGGGA